MKPTHQLVGPPNPVFVILGLICLLDASHVHGEHRSKLSEVVEEAKKPVEEQKVVKRGFRSTQPTQHVSCEDDDGVGLGLLASLFIESMSSQPSSPTSTSAGPIIHDPQLTLTTMVVQPSDGVMDNLVGGGFALRESRSILDFEIGGAYLRGEIKRGSDAYLGIVAPKEIVVSSLARIHSSRDLPFGVNGFLGVQFGLLSWRYSNSVFAVEPDGFGLEVYKDSLGTFSTFIGFGLTPIQTTVLTLGVSFRSGWRSYFQETTEGFQNDLFRDQFFSQVNLELVIRL